MRFVSIKMLAVIATLAALVGCDRANAPTEAVAPVAPAVPAVPAAAAKSAAKTGAELGDPPTAPEAMVEEPRFFYSPFYVELQGEGEFDIITFKDVGLKRQSDDPADPLLEVLAESLSYSIASSSLGYGPAHVSYAEELADPANHKACGQNHLYVDVWKNSQGRYGYSLWSGCGESDNFAWKELEAPIEGASLADEVEPLTRSITDSIAHAKKSNCFQKQC